MSEYIFEKAKNGEFTCKYSTKEHIEKYIYSKYNPRNLSLDWDIDEKADCYIMIGIGLGYEFEYLSELIDKPIFVIELNPIFKEFIKNNREYEPIYIDGIESIAKEYIAPQFLINERLIQFDINMYSSLLASLKSKKLIVCFDYVVILNDCIDVFEKMGYEVLRLNIDGFAKWFENNKQMPEFLFSINFSSVIAEMAEILKIPYISWVVDTPYYPLFNQKNISLEFSYIFHYDEIVTEKLKQRGLKNIFYLPVAANTNRFDTFLDTDSFKQEVTFLGNSCGHNEYENTIKKLFSLEEQNVIEDILTKQCNTNKFIIQSELEKYSDIVNKIAYSPDTFYGLGELDLMEPIEFTSLIIGRQHTFYERQALVELIEQYFDMKVFGDNYWRTTSVKSYAGHADHYKEMPQIFKESKININLIRSFVDSGLPMRVFDVLGCGGFLMTNAKDDIYRYFKDGEHLVVFHDFHDLIEKIKYYLENDEERQRIAKNGYELVRQYHTFEHRIQKMLDIVFGLENR